MSFSYNDHFINLFFFKTSHTFTPHIYLVMNDITYKILSFFNSKNSFQGQIILVFDI
ncbi:protein of unknown function [Chryseobacterium sp. JV274]|nr:protein of unknown function [Chryseobacterium sp. JV274]